MNNDFLNRFRFFRERGWTEIDATTYADVWHLYGGSVITHPDLIIRLSGLAELPVRYFGWAVDNRIAGALASWDRYLALSKDALKHFGRKRLFDLGNAEYILPAAPDLFAPLRFNCCYLSERHARHFTGIIKQRDALMMARSPEDFSRKVRYNLRREWRMLQEAGGARRPIHEFSAAELARIYRSLFERRWQFEVPGQTLLPDVFALLREFMTGFVLVKDDEPIAIQILYKTISPSWISIEYVNGGVLPEASDYSPGSVLSYLNMEAAWEEAHRLGKELRYSFGRGERGYKERWCRPVEVFYR
jgi:hypothetical protein